MYPCWLLVNSKQADRQEFYTYILDYMGGKTVDCNPSCTRMAGMHRRSCHIMVLGVGSKGDR
jgi:hypothetical protein